MTIQAVWDLVRVHWLTLLVAGCLGAAAGAGVSSTIEREYSARAEIFLAVANSSDSAGMAQAATYSQQQARNFAAVATRQLVLEPVADDLGGDLTVGELRAKVSASVPLNTSIVSVQALDPSPQQAARIADAVAVSLADSTERLAPESENRATSLRVQSVEKATVPQVPFSPNVGLLTLLGGLLGLVLGLVLLGIWDQFRGKVRTAEQASALTKAPVLGVISRRRGSQREPMVLASAPDSAHAEQYRQIRANVQALRTNQSHDVFVLTSTVSAEGRSAAAANIAATMAAAGIRVCLVEADLRRPVLASLLGLRTRLGFNAVLSGEVELRKALQPWGTDGLQVLVAGASSDNPRERLASREAAELLAVVRDQFEVTVIDAPPVMAVADATILARMFGGAVMVVSERGVRVRDLERAVERLSRVGAPITGTILAKSRKAPWDRRLRHGYAPGAENATSRDATETPREAQSRPATQLHDSLDAYNTRTQRG